MDLVIKREKGTVDVPVYMRDYTEPKEYSYILSYRGFVAYILKYGAGSWWAVSNGKWLATGLPTKNAICVFIVKFIDDNFDILVEKGYIDMEGN